MGNLQKRKNKYIFIRCFLLFALALCSKNVSAEGKFSDRFPLGKAWVIEKGFGDALPLPFGVHINMFTQKQDLELKESTLTNPVLPAELLDGLILNASSIKSEMISYTLSADVWILPFLSLYAVVGNVDGETIINVSSMSHKTHSDAWLNNLLNSLNLPSSFPFTMEYKGLVLGGGMTVAFGYKDFFGSVDINYTDTDLDISDSTIETLNITPRIGVRGIVGPLDGNIWIGAMHQDTTENIKGKANFLGYAVDFDVVQNAKEPWNYVVGAMWNISKAWHILMEVGIGGRESIYASGEYRF